MRSLPCASSVPAAVPVERAGVAAFADDQVAGAVGSAGEGERETAADRDGSGAVAAGDDAAGLVGADADARR